MPRFLTPPRLMSLRLASLLTRPWGQVVDAPGLQPDAQDAFLPVIGLVVAWELVSGGQGGLALAHAVVRQGYVDLPRGRMFTPVRDGVKRDSQGVRCALADEGVTMSYKYRTVRVRGTELVGTIARKHGSAAEIYETSKDPSTSVVPVFFEATGEIRFFDRSMLEDVVAPAT